MSARSRDLDEARRHHRAGRIDRAASLYQRVLAGDPENADAAHMLGVLSSERGQSAQAAALLERH